MSVVKKNVVSSLFGMLGQIGVNRGVAEFHARRPVLIAGGGESLLALTVEGLDAQRLAEFVALCAPVVPRLVITARRALALGLDATAPVALNLGARLDADMILALVADAKIGCRVDVKAAGPAATAAIQLVKLSQGLPAVLVADVAAGGALEPHIITVEAEAVARFGDDAIRSLTIASQASVPLNSGSRRCDCGDQLQLALKRLEEMRGGVVLYLAQEGRGLGLANKMRTYQMQDDGLDTVDANTTLGFDDDERDYGIAARMLQMLNCTRVVLLTNNPAKLDGLAKAGIEIAGRMPLEAPINADNRRYLTAKAARAGHRLDHLMASLADPLDLKSDVAVWPKN